MNSTTQKTPPAGSAAALDKAIALHKSGQPAAAEAAYEAIIQTSPDCDAAIYRLGIVYMQTGRPKKALEQLQKAIALNPSEPEYPNALATLYLNAGNSAAAKKTFLEALDAHPGHSTMLTNYGYLLVREGNTNEAEKIFERALQENPRNPEALNSLGLIHYNKNQPALAMPLFKRAIEEKPDYVNAWFNLGETLKATRHYAEAADAYRRMTELAPQKAAGWVNFATMIVFENRIEEALSCYRKAIEINPREAVAYLQINYLLKGMNRTGEILALIEQARKNLPGTPITAYIEAQLARKNKEFEKARDLLLPHINNNDVMTRKIHYELGAVFDQLDEPDKAFHHCAEGNRLALDTVEARSLDSESVFREIDTYAKMSSKENLASWTSPVAKPNYTDPVFLVGFPRSGTTLLDQILSAHSGIFISPERESLTPVMMALRNKQIPLIKRLPLLETDEIESLRRIYFDRHKSYGDWQDRAVFIDKMPLNINLLHIIYRLFPKAKIITALRHPCDCVLSNFMYDFTPNNAMIQTNDLQSCARLYAKSMELYEHFKAVLPLPIYELKYEDVVADLRGEAQKVLQFLGLPWDESVMDYHKAAREGKFISTPSAGQVTEKIYTRASYRWLKYRDQLAPVLPLLEPWVKKFGYEMK